MHPIVAKAKVAPRRNLGMAFVRPGCLVSAKNAGIYPIENVEKFHEEPIRIKK
jgi:hypothetical protein